MAYYRTQRRSSPSPFVGFLLVASFGILFAGCGGETVDIPQADEFSFSMEDLEKAKQIANAQSGSSIPRLELTPLAEGQDTPPVIDIGTIGTFNAIRTMPNASDDFFRVTNTFLNVRSEPRVTAPQIGRLERSDSVELIEFVNASWAKIAYEDAEGYVSSRYISKLVSERQLSEEKKQYDGMYFVDFGFLNVRKDADTNSEKIGELAGQSFIKPLTIDEVWARIPFEEGDGYVAVQYLTPFLPNFLVRQSTFELPVASFNVDADGMIEAMPTLLSAIKSTGVRLWTMRDFYNLLLSQEERDVRLDENVLVIAVNGVNAENLKNVSDTLRTSGVSATIFLQGSHIGEGAISQKDIITLLANGHDIQSAAHSGDDLRSLTNAQVELELSQSKQILADATKREIFAISYPAGGVNDRVAKKTAEIGYLLGLSTAQDTEFERSQLLRMPSISARVSMSADELRSLLNLE